MVLLHAYHSFQPSMTAKAPAAAIKTMPMQAEQAQQDVAGLRMQLEAAEAAVNTERQAAATMWAQVKAPCA